MYRIPRTLQLQLPSQLIRVTFMSISDARDEKTRRQHLGVSLK